MIEPSQNSCSPSPCGPNSECRDIGGAPICRCMQTFIGSPPNCRPECSIHADCPSDQSCINSRCKDPCPGTCGIYAKCFVVDHLPICSCEDGYIGDPFTSCRKVQLDSAVIAEGPCYNVQCGSNAECIGGQCQCFPEYHGDPYFNCRPECIYSDDCDKSKTCVEKKCIDPCVGTCGQNALCQVINHIPMCSCVSGFTGNAFIACNPKRGR